MRFAFTEDHVLFRDAAREVLAAACAPAHVRAAWAQPDGRVPGLWASLAEVGLVGLTCPEGDGGMDMDAADWVLIFEELGRAACPEPLLETTAVAAPLLRAIGTDALRARWLPAIAAGEAVIAVGLEGAPWVAHAASADLLLLQRGGAWHALTPDRVALTPRRSVDGARKLAAVEFADAPFADGPAADAAAEMAGLRGALAASAMLVGLSRSMLQLAVDYAKVREQFGRPVGSFQAVKHHLADALLRADFAAAPVYRAAWSLSGRSPRAAVDVSMAKVYASEAAVFVGKKALQVHGAIGYTTECDLHHWMKRAWALSRAWGDPATHRARLQAAVLGAPSGDTEPLDSFSAETL